MSIINDMTPDIEKKILKFWEEKKIFEKLRKKNRGKKRWSFLDGPITANNPMGVHHAWGRTYKDVFQRYKAMQGFDQRYQNGFDCQGLWVEVEVEKELGFKTKKDIENFGIGRFVEKCKERVRKYSRIQTEQSIRLGQWMDWPNSYYTMSDENNYAIWHFLKRCWKKGLLYKGRDVVPWCLRCGTAISQHEILTEEYKELTHKSVFLKFPINGRGRMSRIDPGANLLVWTTTPWTLAANVAVAVHPDFDYIEARKTAGIRRKSAQRLILAKKLFSVLGEGYEITREFKGKELIGLKYRGPFDNLPIAKNLKHRVISWEEVSEEEGTGLVHIAPGCGQEDFALSKAENLEVIDPIDEEGRYKKGFGWLEGKLVTEVTQPILEDLEKRGFVFRIEDYTHRYPTCWRCKSELIFRLVDEWYIAMDKLRKPLMRVAKKIKWIPEFGLERELDWLRNMQDWLISKKRYWGLALPIFECSCGHFEVLGGREELIKRAAARNNFYVLRHPEATSNVLGLVADKPDDKNIKLTDKGKAQLPKIAKELKAKKIDLIFASDFYRIKQTAQYIAKALKISLYYDKRLRELNCGIFSGRKIAEHKRFFGQPLEKFTKRPPKGENLTDVKKRMLEAVRDINQRYEGKNILIVGHGDPLWVLEGAVRGLKNEEILTLSYIRTGEWRKLPFKELPFNFEGEIEPHRPYIDKVQIKCKKCGQLVSRIPDVGNPWLDAGIVPFSTMAYFVDKEYWKKWFPADLVCESFPGQFRNWFYSIIAMSTVLENKPPVKTIFGYGLVVDERGEEMHKSKGNAIEFNEAAEKIGTDVMRWMYVRQNPAVNLKFGFRVADQIRRKLLILWNTFVYYKTYADIKNSNSSLITHYSLLDRWILSRLNSLISLVQKNLDNYNVAAASQAIENFFIEDLSTWYIRRSRQRFQGPKNKKEHHQASLVLRYVLLELTKLIAPMTPSLSEEIYQEIKTKDMPESVHLCDFPKVNKKSVDLKLEEKMKKAREIAALALSQRARAGIKVRQPLASLRIKKFSPLDNFISRGGDRSKIKDNKELLQLVKEEINVKKIIFDSKIKEEVELDTKITPKLKEEGIVRELIRQVQQMRKEAGLKPKDEIVLKIKTDKVLGNLILRNEKLIKKEVNAWSLKLGRSEKFDVEKETKIDEKIVWLGLQKVVRG